MNVKRPILGLALCSLVFIPSARAETRFVSGNGTHVAPFTNWMQAATNIASALAVAINGDTVLVSNGIYYLTSQIQVTNGVHLLSVNGPESATIDGQGATRCLYLSHSNALAEGFTIRNGFMDGAGGGGVICDTAGTVRGCTISHNSATTVSGGGGGVFLNGGGIVDRCRIVSNSVESINFISGNGMGGGGVTCAYGGLVENSIIAYNVSHAAGTGGGGGVSCWGVGTIRNSAVFANTNFSGEGYGGGGICVAEETDVRIENCTIVQNLARGWVSGDQGYGGGLWSWYGCTVVNTIVYSNSATTAGSNVYQTGEVSVFYNCCTVPLPSLGADNLTNHPSLDASSYRLLANSPCIDAGTNAPFMQDALDIDLQPRVFNGHVDIGADEASIIAHSIASTGIVSLAWDVISGSACQLRVTTNLTDSAWEDVGPRFTNDTNEITLTDTLSTTTPHMYQLLWLRP